jgi:CBS domain-containing protein
MLVKELMTDNVRAVSANATVCEAAQGMADACIGALPVAQDQKLVGMLTDRDITVRVVSKALDPNKTTVSEVMTPGIFALIEDLDVAEAGKRMRAKQVRRAPVMNADGQLVGIVSLADFAVKSGNTELNDDVLKGVSEPAVPNLQ